MRIAVEGCMHGDLDNVYSTLLHLQEAENTKIDLLICCGDFQVATVLQFLLFLWLRRRISIYWMDWDYMLGIWFCLMPFPYLESHSSLVYWYYSYIQCLAMDLFKCSTYNNSFGTGWLDLNFYVEWQVMYACIYLTPT